MSRFPRNVRRFAAGLIVLAVAGPAFAAVPVDQLVRQINADDWMLQAEALAEIADADPRAAAAVLRPIVADNHRPAWVRGRALVTLATLSADQAVDPAARLVRSDDADLRVDALTALGLVGGAAAKPHIEAHLDDPDPRARAAAAAALARVDPDRAWPMLRKAMPAADGQALLIYAGAVPYFDNNEAHALARQLIEHEDPAVRRSVILSLGRRSDDASLRLLMLAAGSDPVDANRRAAEKSLLRLEPERLERLIRDGLAGDDPADLRAAMRLVRHVPADSVADAIAGHIDRIDAIGGLADALAVLAGADSAQYLPVFRKGLADPNAAVRSAAVEGIAAMADVDLFKELAGRLTDEKRNLRERVERLLLAAPAPVGGVVQYVRPLVDARDATMNDAAARLLNRHLTRDDLAAATRLLRPWLASHNRDTRKRADFALSNAVTADNVWIVAGLSGYLYDWRVIGPFANDPKNTGFKRAYPPEKQLDFDATYNGVDGHTAAWKDYRANREDGLVPVHSLMPLPAHYRIAYAYTVVNAPADQRVRMSITYDDSIAVWLNGRELVREHGKNGVNLMVDLKRGANPLLVKIANLRDYWQFSVRLAEEDGKPIDWLVP